MGAKAKHDIAPLIRGGFRRGLMKYMSKHKKTLSDVFQDWIEADGIGNVIRSLSPYNVREARLEQKVNHEHKHIHEGLSETLGWVTEMLGGKEEGSPQESCETRPLLPDSLPPEQSRH